MLREPLSAVGNKFQRTVLNGKMRTLANIANVNAAIAAFLRGGETSAEADGIPCTVARQTSAGLGVAEIAKLL